MQRGVWLRFSWEVVQWLWMATWRITTKETLKKVAQLSRTTKEISAGLILYPHILGVPKILHGLITMAVNMACLACLGAILLGVLIWRIIQRVIVSKLAMAVYLACFDYYDRKYYRLFGSRGVFDASMCLFLVFALFWGLYNINQDTITFLRVAEPRAKV
ncbi:hypothetical protein NEDG_00902 [Nematocida displodere]|uniref:Uncharacterized protein n=1 Tax=Nematocida displodere TaxID=1805483 RepID=A0A177EFK0_9MICR|nr:hypothetical protein NEDG_00902 [Nematocida displodere]